MANKKSLKDYEENISINNDNTLLRARLARALTLRADIKSVAILIESVVIYKLLKLKALLRSSYMNGIQI